MAIVMDFYSGATRIIIRDDHCCAKEDVPKILEKIGHHVYEELYIKKQSKILRPLMQYNGGRYQWMVKIAYTRTRTKSVNAGNAN